MHTMTEWLWHEQFRCVIHAPIAIIFVSYLMIQYNTHSIACVYKHMLVLVHHSLTYCNSFPIQCQGRIYHRWPTPKILGVFSRHHFTYTEHKQLKAALNVICNLRQPFIDYKFIQKMSSPNSASGWNSLGGRIAPPKTTIVSTGSAGRLWGGG